MRNVTEKALEDGAKVLTISTGAGTSAGSWLGFLNGNAPAIGLLLTLIFGLCSIYFQWHRNKSTDKSKDNEKRIESQEKEIEALHRKLKEMNERI